MTQQESRSYVPQQRASGVASEPSGWVGMVVFGAVMMLMIGVFTAFAGLAALFDDEFFVVTETAVINVDITAWGWTWLLLGLAVAGTGIAILAGQAWARWVGVALVGLNAFSQLVSMPLYPWWSLVILTLDVLVIYALVAHGREISS